MIDHNEIPKIVHAPTYRCQFCGETSPASQWGKDEDTCPKCGEKYDALLAQDSEE